MIFDALAGVTLGKIVLAPPERRELKRRARKRSLAAESLGPPVKSRAHPQPRRPRPTRKRSVFTVILAFCFGQSSPTSDGGGKKLPSATQRKQSKLLLCFAYVSDQKESSSCILWLVEVLQQLKRANEAQSVGVDFITEAKSTLQKVSSDHGLSSNDPKFRSLADEKFNALMTATLLAQPKSFRQAVASDWLEGQNWPCGFFTHCAISGTAIDWNNDPLSTKMQPLRSLATFSQFSFADLNALAKNFKDPFVADNIAIWHLIVAVCILSVLAGVLRIPAWNIAIAITMLAVGELIYLLTCAVAGQVCRYGIPFLELALCAVLTLIAGILDCFILRWNQSRNLQRGLSP